MPPGRLRDALERGTIDATGLAAVVLDEADSMLDLGFREDLEAILAMLPKERRSHLVSATFSRDVVALAEAQWDVKLANYEVQNAPNDAVRSAGRSYTDGP